MESIDGFIVIDKPRGPTSHQVDSWVRELTGVSKVGHVGTLDPYATGVLVMALGKAVKLIDMVHEMPKEYVCTMKFHSDIPENEVREKLEEFTGSIYQIPPIRSAVARSLRIRKIHAISDIEVDGRSVLFRVKCESGTYIRTLCTDLGYASGRFAQMQDLRRTMTGSFDEKQMITLQQLSDYIVLRDRGDPAPLNSAIVSMDTFFAGFPKVVAKNSAIANISHGSDLYPGGIRAITGEPGKGDRVCVVGENNQVLGTGKMLVDYDAITELKVVDFDRILIEPMISSTGERRTAEVVRPDKERQKVHVQKSGVRVPGNIRGSKDGKDSRDRGGTGKRRTGPQRKGDRVRKNKGQKKLHR